MNFWIIIPSRYASTRLPGKPLAEIDGKPMVVHVYKKACSSGAARVIVATDDQRIEDCLKGVGAEVIQTASDHASGTDRVAEAARLAGAEKEQIIVNLQGDEPGMLPALLDQVALSLHQHSAADVATLTEEISDPEILWNPNSIKVVRDKNNFALYFSRAPIPWVRGQLDRNQPAQAIIRKETALRHIGLYAYRNEYLQQLTQFPVCNLEQDEALEQLRVLYHGGKIIAETACKTPPAGIDTPADLLRWQKAFN
ncbi:MAG: 3-deoxy-manno-octulosonate cytidylyltransferase [Pseudomonadota bacterium]